MNKCLIAICLVLVSSISCGSDDSYIKSQVPSHLAEFEVPLEKYSELLSKLDKVSTLFGLKRISAAPGISQLHGRQVLFAAYKSNTDKKQWKQALDLTDVKGQGRIVLRLYSDYFKENAKRDEYVEKVASVVKYFGGNLFATKE